MTQLWTLGSAEVSRAFVLLRVCVGLCVLGLLAIPALAAVDDTRPSRFGWQMYSAAVDLPDIDVVLSDGSREERSIANIASGFRPEIDYFGPVARFICDKEPNVSSVHMTRQHPQYQVVFKCAQL